MATVGNFNGFRLAQFLLNIRVKWGNYIRRVNKI